MTPLYVRIPESQAKRIDSLALALGQSKQQVVTEILGSGLAQPTVDSEVSVPYGSEVLTMDQATTLLGVSIDSVEEAIRTAGLPARRIGGEWRFAKQAILGWLAMPDPSIKARPGFTQRATS